MVRESLLLVLAATVPGCSLILDFSDKAGVHDASLDGPYTKDQCDYKEPNDTIDDAYMKIGKKVFTKVNGVIGQVVVDPTVLVVTGNQGAHVVI